MKRALKIFLTICVAALTLASCKGKNDKDKKGALADADTTESGLIYKFIEKNNGAQKVQLGDVIVGTLKMSIGDSVLYVIDKAQRFPFVIQEPLFRGDLPEGLLMMHIGDKAVFGIDADSLAEYGMTLPDYYKPGTQTKVYYEIYVEDIVTRAEIEEEYKTYTENILQTQEEEKVILAKYVKDHKLKGKPDEQGLYVIVNKKGKGNKVEIGRMVSQNYTAKFLDGKVFDTNIEKVAKDNNIHISGRKYFPMTYQFGAMRLIPGWEMGIINQTAGSKLTLLIPSILAFGPEGNEIVPGDTPIILDIEIVSVK